MSWSMLWTHWENLWIWCCPSHHTIIPFIISLVSPYLRSRTTYKLSSWPEEIWLSPEMLMRSLWTSIWMLSLERPGSSNVAVTVLASAFSCRSILWEFKSSWISLLRTDGNRLMLTLGLIPARRLHRGEQPEQYHSPSGETHYRMCDKRRWSEMRFS